MKRWKVLLFTWAVVLGMTGCTDAGKKLSFSIDEANKIVLRSGNDGKTVEITDEEEIRYITENINAIEFDRGESGKDYTGWSYWLKWYDSEEMLLEDIVIMSKNQIDYKDYFYKSIAADCEIDIAFLDSLLNTEE